MSAIVLPSSLQSGFACPWGRTPWLQYPQLWEGCVGAWCPSLGATGGTLWDWSGYCNHGTLTNMDPASDWVVSGGQRALDFDGTNDYVDIGDRQLFTATSDFTLCAWVKWDGTTGNNPILNKAGTNGNREWQLTIDTSQANDLGFLIGNTSGSWSTLHRVGSTWGGANEWHHIVGRLSGSNVEIFIDGEPAGSSSTYSGGGIKDTSNAIEFGRSLSEYFPGQLDDIRIYNRALSPQEIRVLTSRRAIAYETDFVSPFAVQWGSVAAEVAASGGPFPHFLRRANSMSGGMLT